MTALKGKKIPLTLHKNTLYDKGVVGLQILVLGSKAAQRPSPVLTRTSVTRAESSPTMG